MATKSTKSTKFKKSKHDKMLSMWKTGANLKKGAIYKMVESLIQGNSEQASIHFNDYLRLQTRELLGEKSYECEEDVDNTKNKKMDDDQLEFEFGDEMDDEMDDEKNDTKSKKSKKSKTTDDIDEDEDDNRDDEDDDNNELDDDSDKESEEDDNEDEDDKPTKSNKK